MSYMHPFTYRLALVIDCFFPGCIGHWRPNEITDFVTHLYRHLADLGMPSELPKRQPVGKHMKRFFQLICEGKSVWSWARPVNCPDVNQLRIRLNLRIFPVDL